MASGDRSVGMVTRWGRALLLSGVALLAGAIAHVGAGGMLPGLVVLFVLLAGCTAVSATLLGRPASTLRIVILLTAGQALIHGAMTALSGHRGDPALQAAPPVASDLPHQMAAVGARRVGSLREQLYGTTLPGGADPGSALALPYPVQHLVADFTGPNALMALGHVAAAALVGLWLAAGERALWTILTLLADTVRPAVTALVAGLAFASARPFVVGDQVAHARLLSSARAPTRLRRCSDLLARSVVRRGPPALLPA